MAAFGHLVGKGIPDRIFATQLACLFVLPAAILGGYTFPLMAMPGFFHILRVLIPFSYYGEDLRNLALMELDIKYFTSSLLYYLTFLFVELIAIYCITLIGDRRESPSVICQDPN
jgi:ABC-2 type transport system permease protein